MKKLKRTPKLLTTRNSKSKRLGHFSLPGFISILSLGAMGAIALTTINGDAAATTYSSPRSTNSNVNYNGYYNAPSTIKVTLGNGVPSVWYQVTTSETAPDYNGSGWTQVRAGTNNGTASNVATQYRYQIQTTDVQNYGPYSSPLSDSTIRDWQNSGYSVSYYTSKTNWVMQDYAYRSNTSNANGSALFNHWLTNCQAVTNKTYPLQGRTPVYKSAILFGDADYTTAYNNSAENTRCRFERSGFMHYSSSNNNAQFTSGAYQVENLNPGMSTVYDVPSSTHNASYANGVFTSNGYTKVLWSRADALNKNIYELGAIVYSNSNLGDASILLPSNKGAGGYGAIYYHYYVNPSVMRSALSGYKWADTHIYSANRSSDAVLMGLDIGFNSYSRTTQHHYTFSKTTIGEHLFQATLPSASNVVNTVQVVKSFDLKLGEGISKDTKYYVYIKQDNGLGTQRVERAGTYALDAQNPSPNAITYSSTDFCTIANNTLYPRKNSTFSLTLGASDVSWLKEAEIQLIDTTQNTRKAAATHQWDPKPNYYQSQGAGEVVIAEGASVVSYTSYRFSLTPQVSGRLYDIYYRFTDRHGRTMPLSANNQGLKVLVDWESPTVSVTGSNSWNNQSVPVTIAVQDTGGAGLKEIYYRLINQDTNQQLQGWTSIPNNSTIYVAHSGRIRVEAYAIDNSCNQSATESTVVYVDTTAPTLSNVLITNAEYINGGDYWVRAGSPFEIEVEAQDDLSRLSRTEIQLYSGTTGSQLIGRHNWESGSSTSLDLENPNSTISLTSGVVTKDSGLVQAFRYSLMPNTDSKTFNVRYRLTDIAGNVNGFTDTLLNIRIDGQAPTCSIQSVSGWVNTNVTASAQCQDGPGSGVQRLFMKLEGANSTQGAFQEVSSLFLTEAGVTTVSVYAIDNVGNQSPVITRQVTIDKQNPIINIYASPTDWVNGVVEVIAIANDDRGIHQLEYMMSGATEVLNWTPYTQALYVSNDGLTTVYVRAIDVAGNVSETKEVTVKIDLFNPSVDKFEIIVK